jgi:hypothetical protein
MNIKREKTPKYLQAFKDVKQERDVQKGIKRKPRKTKFDKAIDVYNKMTEIL